MTEGSRLVLKLASWSGIQQIFKHKERERGYEDLESTSALIGLVEFDMHGRAMRPSTQLQTCL